jgi:hypothetical protein
VFVNREKKGRKRGKRATKNTTGHGKKTSQEGKKWNREPGQRLHRFRLSIVREGYGHPP